MPRESIHASEDHEKALAYPYEDAAQAMANECNRSKQSKRQFIVEQCGSCKKFHVIQRTYLTR